MNLKTEICLINLMVYNRIRTIWIALIFAFDPEEILQRLKVNLMTNKQLSSYKASSGFDLSVTF